MELVRGSGATGGGVLASRARPGTPIPATVARGSTAPATVAGASSVPSRTLISVAPMTTRSPGPNAVGPSIRRPLTIVPFVLARSVTTRPWSPQATAT